MTRIYNVKLEGFCTPKNHDEFVKLLKEATNDEYEVISKYSMMNGYCKFLHKKCGSEFRVTPYNLLIRGNGCPDCKDEVDISHILHPPILNNNTDIDSIDNDTLVKHAEFTKKLYEKYTNEYVALEHCKSPTYSIQVIHTKCKTTFKRSPNELLNSNIICPHCNPRIKWDINKIKKTINKITKGEFEVVSNEYITIDTPLEIKHNVCGGVFSDSPNAFMKTPKCKLCENDMSLNEKRIKDFFIANNIEYKREYGIENCRFKNPLKFDFAVFKNCELICLIEYDGEQHYRPIFDDERFIGTQWTDRTKNKFCYDNNITLIRIPFWESENLNRILKREMKKLNIL